MTQPSLSSRTPSLRERMADYIARTFFTDDRAGNRAAESYVNALDFSPAGIPMAAYDAGRMGAEAAQRPSMGSILGTSLAALGAVPALKPAAKMGGVLKPIRAYHGSPHDFDKFDMSRIGTGEGAQAYGHGLYFAEKEGVAKAYRDTLAPARSKIPDDMISMPPEFRRALMAQVNTDADPLTAAKRAQYMAAGLRKSDPEKLADMIARTREAQRGRMYEVNINADPADFLDWDKPLGEQMPKFQEALGITPRDFGAEDNLLVRRWLIFRKARELGVSPTELPEYAALQTSQETPASLLGRAYRNEMHAGDLIGKDRASPSELSATLAERGIPGIKYLDQGSRAAGDGSRNYVVFDDKLIEILRKYGILPAAVTGGAAAYGTGQPAEPTTY